MTISSTLEKCCKYLILFIFVLITVFPLFWMVNMSFKQNTEIVAGNVMALPEMPTLENYANAWTTGKVGEYFMNSVLIAVVSSILTLLFGTPLAYALCRLYWKIKNWVFTLIIMGIMVPVHATLIPLFILYNKIGILNTYITLILPYTAAALPLTVYIIRNFLISVPLEMEEAAFIDGCGIVRGFVKIMLPTIKQSLIVVTILNFLFFWNEFIMASTLVNDTRLYTIPVGLSYFQGQYSVDYGGIIACTVISVLPILVTYLFFNTALEKGMVVGAMK
jgi:raffinose/stachyose/melibiose transport system permease protein